MAILNKEPVRLITTEEVSNLIMELDDLLERRLKEKQDTHVILPMSKTIQAHKFPSLTPVVFIAVKLYDPVVTSGNSVYYGRGEAKGIDMEAIARLIGRLPNSLPGLPHERKRKKLLLATECVDWYKQHAKIPKPEAKVENQQLMSAPIPSKSRPIINVRIKNNNTIIRIDTDEFHISIVEG